MQYRIALGITPWCSQWHFYRLGVFRSGQFINFELFWCKPIHDLISRLYSGFVKLIKAFMWTSKTISQIKSQLKLCNKCYTNRFRKIDKWIPVDIQLKQSMFWRLEWTEAALDEGMAPLEEVQFYTEAKLFIIGSGI